MVNAAAGMVGGPRAGRVPGQITAPAFSAWRSFPDRGAFFLPGDWPDDAHHRPKGAI